MTVIDGRPSLPDEVIGSSGEVKAYVAQSLTNLLSEPHFLEALPGYLLPDTANQARFDQLMRTLGELAKQA
ncbi:MAG: hypothetical protein WBC92_18965 [Terracidiphilus sp.]